MPARVSIELDEGILALAISELELDNPPGFTLNGESRVCPGGNSGKLAEIRGLYDPARNHVLIATQGESFEREGFYVLTKHLRFTVLHELRHAWQREKWTPEEQRRAAQGPYHLRHEEIDANAWADYASPKYRGLVRVKRQPVGKSGFSRLSAHTNRRNA